MDIFKIKIRDNGHSMIFKEIRNGEGGFTIFGVEYDHVTPMKIMNEFCNEEVFTIHGYNESRHLFMPQRLMNLWSEKTTPTERYWSKDPYGIKLDIMKKET